MAGLQHDARQTGTEGDKLLETMQRATPLMLRAVAVAIGFKMNLFNIGVEGQFLIGMFIAAVVGAESTCPHRCTSLFILVVAMTAGAAWAGIAAVLKVKRGVNEVISTIMLNYVALSVITGCSTSSSATTASRRPRREDQADAAESAWMPDIVDGPARAASFIVALLVVLPLLGAGVQEPLRLPPAGLGRSTPAPPAPRASTPTG